MNVTAPFRRTRYLAAAALLLSLPACAGKGSEDAVAGSKAAAAGITLVKPGKLTVCTHGPYKPFLFRDGTKSIGFDVDLLNLVAEDLDLEQEVVNVEWIQVTSGAGFAAGKCDMGMGAMTITKERQAAIGITDPYMDATQVLLTTKASEIRSLADLRGKKIGVNADSTGEKYAKANAEKFGYTVIRFADLALGENNIKSGRVDALVNDNGVLYPFAAENPELAVVAEFDTGEKYGFAARKNDPSGTKLVERFNALLKRAKSDGSYAETYRKWFGVDPK
ncbi:ABC transporter substrate-binding protein [Kribbella sp. NPDC056861]|uniref:ABC transporter substrate-binding protein n=1 Tax=Kribbella sp. NPDC056861 TaxID=3154857 RepID=UPI00341E7EDD